MPRMDKHRVTELRDTILEKALPHVPFDGWSWPVMVKAAKECGQGDDTLRAVFPDKMPDVLDAFADYADRKMLTRLDAINPDDLRIRDRIRTGVMERLLFLQPHRESVRQSLEFWLLPHRQIRAGRIVWRTADRIWGWAGDVSQDYNHYTKRGLLSGILASTMLVWINDDDPAMAKTAAFLDQRIENVMQFGKVLGKIKKKT